MKQFIIVLLALCLTTTALAETELTLSGQVRMRYELDNKSFYPSDKWQEYGYLRTRAAVKALIDGNTEVFVQLQDSRLVGGQNEDGDYLSGSLADGENVDLHQGYVIANKILGRGTGLKAGRFEFVLGNQRVFGSVGWSNVGRSWEGVQLWMESEQLKITPFWLKRKEGDAFLGSRDHDLLGANIRIKNSGLEFFGVYEKDDNYRIDAESNEINLLDRLATGAYFAKDFGSVDIVANAVYQTGNQLVGHSAPTYAEADIAAFLVTGEIGISPASEKVKRVAAGFDYASGDDDPADNKIKTYDNMYYTGHKFRGYMDYFVSSNSEGLIDLYANGIFIPQPGWSVRGDVHYFMTAQDYENFESELTSDVGIELDLSVTTTRVAGVTIQGGGSFFAATDSWAGRTDKDPGLWGYLQLTADF